MSTISLVSLSTLSSLALAAFVLMPAAPAPANAVETPLCQTYLTTAVASMQASQTRLQSLRGKAGGDLCTITRSHYLEVVKTRAVMALCKSGTDRSQDVGRLDAAIEELDDVIASRCSS
jgi:hypothetical protein